MRRRLVVTAFALLACIGGQRQDAAAQESVETRPPNGVGQAPAFQGQTRAPRQKTNVAFEVVTVAEGLENPWGLAFLPDGRMMVTERAGRLRIVGTDGKLSEPVAGVPVVDAPRPRRSPRRRARSPLRIESTGLSELRRTTGGRQQHGRRYEAGWLDGAAPHLEGVRVIFRQAPSLNSRAHFGGRLVFRRDGTLFVTLGERADTEGRMQAQRMDGLLGKIVRINADGSIPKDNPFVGKVRVRPEIWSLGHRNVQGATLHPTTGELWEVEHGTRGGDEINIARAGKDYGWPTIAYGIEYNRKPITGGVTAKEGMEQPLYYWDPVIAPSGMTFYTGALFPQWRGSLFVGGLGSTHLARLAVDGERIVGEERLLTDLKPRERIRDVRQGPEGALYILTDNPKGRVLKLVPKGA